MMIEREETQVLSTTGVAKILGVAPASVANWVNKGKLKAGRTPGGHRRVSMSDLLNFADRRNLPVPPELRPSPSKILIVDDEESLVKLLVEEIRKRYPDLKILTAYDGYTAGHLVGAERPDVVLLDLRMPGMDGFEVCRRIKADQRTKDVVVIAMTAYLSSEVEAQVLEAGAECYLPKPLETEMLAEKLESVLRLRI